MFTMSWSTPTEIKGTIQVRKPIQSLGPVKDITGQQWDIRAIIGKTVNACKMEELHPHYYDTSGTQWGFVGQEWQPYSVEVVNDSITP